MYSTFGRMNSSQTDFDLINSVHAHRKTGRKLELSVTFLTGNTFVITKPTAEVGTSHEVST